jgi:hypothetical protein
MLSFDMPRPFLLALALTLLATTAPAQWQLQDAHTTADLRGIDNVGGGVAWASGSDGTILRTEDAGFVWQLCAKPPGAEHLDFRAIQASDNNTAIIMSSGKGDLSRLYKTTDGCQTWKLLFTNPDKNGFWDGITAQREKDGHSAVVLVAGDPVGGEFTLFRLRVSFAGATAAAPIPLSACNKSVNTLQLPPRVSTCEPDTPRFRSPLPDPDEALFAASNSSLFTESKTWFEPIGFITGGPSGARFLAYGANFCAGLGCGGWLVADLPLAKGASAGAFSVAIADAKAVVVGGDYTKPNESHGTAAWSKFDGQHWTSAATPPHGYRSAVAYDPTSKTWITVGPNGTDISTDDGRNWRALHPDPRFNEASDADQHWNALSLPFVVGPHGRIGTLRPSALKAAH